MTNIFHRFADEMEKKFKIKAKEKGYSLEPWEHYPVNFLLNRLREEAQELYSAMDRYNNICSSLDNLEETEEVLKEVKEECIDVANFCMFIYSKVELLSNGKEIPKPIGYNQIRSLNFKK